LAKPANGHRYGRTLRKSRLIYDGPRLDVAELNSVPYIYEAEFDHSTDEYGDTYFLPATTANRAILSQLPASNSGGFVSIVAVAS